MQSPWAQTGQYDALQQEPYPGSYGCRVASGGHSNLEQSAMVTYLMSAHQHISHGLNILSLKAYSAVL